MSIRPALGDPFDRVARLDRDNDLQRGELAPGAAAVASTSSAAAVFPGRKSRRRLPRPEQRNGANATAAAGDEGASAPSPASTFIISRNEAAVDDQCARDR
jgi:hypothetical protein